MSIDYNPYNIFHLNLEKVMIRKPSRYNRLKFKEEK